MRRRFIRGRTGQDALPAQQADRGREQREAHREQRDRAGLDGMAEQHLEHHQAGVHRERHEHVAHRGQYRARFGGRRAHAREAAEREQDRERDDHPAREALHGLAEPPAVRLRHDPGLQHVHHVRVDAEVVARDDHRAEQGHDGVVAE
jgi:hypothetical protein